MIAFLVSSSQTLALFVASFTGAMWINVYYHGDPCESLWKRWFLCSASVVVVTTVILKVLTIFKILTW